MVPFVACCRVLFNVGKALHVFSKFFPKRETELGGIINEKPKKEKLRMIYRWRNIKKRQEKCQRSVKFLYCGILNYAYNLCITIIFLLQIFFIVKIERTEESKN